MNVLVYFGKHDSAQQSSLCINELSSGHIVININIQRCLT